MRDCSVFVNQYVRLLYARVNGYGDVCEFSIRES